MARQKPVKLSEDPNAAPPGARVIDAEFRVVRKGGGGWKDRALATVLVAVSVGFLLPPILFLASVLSE